MAKIVTYQDLVVWQKSMELAKSIYHFVWSLPPEEEYALGDQMRRAVVSIPSNIAEGQARKTTKDFVHFLYIARGSNAELMTHLLLCQSLGYIDEKRLRTLKEGSDEIGRLLSSLIKTLKSKAE